MSKDLTVFSRIQDPLSFAMTFGTELAKSRIFGCENESQGRVLALACLAEGKNPIDIARTHHIIQGNLSMRADAMLAAFNRMGGKHKVVERTADRAEVVLTAGDESYTESLSWDEAQQEPYVYEKDGKTLKKNWRTPRARRQMLWARVISEAVRTLRPEIVAGSYTPEEIYDFEPTKPVQSVQPVDVEQLVRQKAGESSQVVETEIRPANVASEDMVGESRLPDNATTSHVTGPVDQVTVDEIKSLLHGDPETIKQVKAHLLKHGKAKISDLSMRDADLLRNCLELRQLESFFEQVLSAVEDDDVPFAG